MTNTEVQAYLEQGFSGLEKLMKSYQKMNDERHHETRETLDKLFEGQAEMLKRQNMTNGKVLRLEEKQPLLEETHAQVQEVQDQISSFRWIIGHWKLVATGVVVLVFGSAVLANVLSDRIDWRQSVEKALDNRGIVIDGS